MADLAELVDDLSSEHEELDGVLTRSNASAWDAPTPAEGWSVRDQVSHLAFFDEQATLAVVDPDAFARGLEVAAGDVESFMNDPLEKGRSASPSEVLEWWRRARAEMLEAFSQLDPSRRVPWFGPAMSAGSFVTARLMETWAHGQDVCDALEIARTPTDRLRHVVFLGVRARPFSYIANGLAQPAGDVRVELQIPSGDLLTYGDSRDDLVRGSALDFCLVVTQRRHVDDTELDVTGPLAKEWMSIAQAFAGPPGKGRAPGQFPKDR